MVWQYPLAYMDRPIMTSFARELRTHSKESTLFLNYLWLACMRKTVASWLGYGMYVRVRKKTFALSSNQLWGEPVHASLYPSLLPTCYNAEKGKERKHTHTLRFLHSFKTLFHPRCSN